MKRKIGLAVLITWLFSLVMLALFFLKILPDSSYNGGVSIVILFLIIVFCVLVLFPIWTFLIGNKLLKIISFIPMGLVALAYLVNLIIRPHKIIGGRMEPALANNSYFLSERWSYLFAAPKRGDLIVYNNFGSERVGRIVGMPSERIDVVNQKVYINGKELLEPYSNWNNYDNNSTYGFTLTNNEYWAPFDSRADSYLEGDVSNINDISGKVIYTYWPPQNHGLVHALAGTITSKELKNETKSDTAIPTCKTLGTQLFITSPRPNYQSQIGCDIEVNGRFDLSKSYCESRYLHNKAYLVPDAYGKSNRYYATLYNVNAKEEVDVYIYSLSGQRIFCSPPLNLK